MFLDVYSHTFLIKSRLIFSRKIVRILKYFSFSCHPRGGGDPEIPKAMSCLSILVYRLYTWSWKRWSFGGQASSGWHRERGGV